MKTIENKTLGYETPVVKLITVVVEKGFAASEPTGSAGGFNQY